MSDHDHPISGLPEGFEPARNVFRSKVPQLSKKARAQAIIDLLIRDGNKCSLCRTPLGFDITIDHKIPRDEGGSNDLVNLQLAHWMCNVKKFTKLGYRPEPREIPPEPGPRKGPRKGPR